MYCVDNRRSQGGGQLEMGLILGIVQYLNSVVVCLLGIPDRLIIYVVYVYIVARNNRRYYPRSFGCVDNKTLYKAKKFCIVL